MSYENAPATHLVATECCVCNRPLVDAVSVETGMGPTCREKYGVGDDGTSIEERRQANKLTWAIAADSSDPLRTVACLRELRMLGFNKLADAIEKKRVTIHIEVTPNRTLHVKAPLVDGADWRLVRGQKWNPVKKVRVGPVSERVSLYRVLMRHYMHAIGRGPKGLFVVGVTT